MACLCVMLLYMYVSSKRSQVLGACPIESYRETLPECLDRLIARKILSVETSCLVICNPVGDKRGGVGRVGGGQRNEETIRFAHGYMAEVVRDRLLSSQRGLLHQSITAWSEAEDAERRRTFLLAIRRAPCMTSMTSGCSNRSPTATENEMLKSGWLYVKKHTKHTRGRRFSMSVAMAVGRRRSDVGMGDAKIWKRRWAVLTVGRLDIFHDPQEQRSQHAAESIPLVNAW